MEKQQNELKKKTGEGIALLIFGGLWLAMSVLIFMLYQSNDLGESIQIPRLLMIFYDIFGIEIGAIVQFILSGIMVITGMKILMKKNKPLT